MRWELLKPYLFWEPKKVSWSSSKVSVATVSSSGKVTAKAAGTATIYASVAGKKLSVKVTVKAAAANSITATPTPTPIPEKSPVIIQEPTVTSTKPTPSDIKSNVTDAKPTDPDTKPKNPDTKPTDPDIKPTAPDTKPKNPDTKPTNPDAKPKDPDIKPKEPDSKPTVPDIEPTIPASKNNVHIVGYYAAWGRYSGFTPDKLDADKLSHINYAFANIGSDLTIKAGYPDVDEANIRELVKLKKINPNLKIIIAVGGWTWSGRFSDVAFTQEARDKFADSVVDFIIKYNIDGVDLDWEYPVSGGLITNSRRPEDKHNFTLLMKTLREKLYARGAIDGKHYILSFAGAAGSWYTRNVELAELSKYVDYANVMTYDIHGTWDANTGFNAPLYNYNGINGDLSVDSGISAWINAGFSKEKIVMGVPFYGYIYISVPAVNDGLGQTYSGGASISYGNIAASYLKLSEYKRFYHPTAKVPWLFNGSTFISYEDEQSMADKAKYIKDKGLLGAMIWELSQDPDRVLFNSLYNGLKAKKEN